MPVSTARWVLWVSLLILLPFPFHIHYWGLLPLGAVLKSLLSGYLEQLYNVSSLEQAFIVAQCLVATLITALISWVYGYYSSNWQEKIRGSVMSIVVFSALIIFSTMAVYSNQLIASSADNRPGQVTFLRVYP
jgi:ABC-type transporter Mla maintaining outer membrane lipid asymmetry permease subunit MlaE